MKSTSRLRTGSRSSTTCSATSPLRRDACEGDFQSQSMEPVIACVATSASRGDPSMPALHDAGAVRVLQGQATRRGALQSTSKGVEAEFVGRQEDERRSTGTIRKKHVVLDFSWLASARCCTPIHAGQPLELTRHPYSQKTWDALPRHTSGTRRTRMKTSSPSTP